MLIVLTSQMIEFRSGNILQSNAQTVVNTVNCVGVMGKGLALQFKKMYPQMFDVYKTKCKRGEVQIGKPYLYKVSMFRWILNFPTKEHWACSSQIEWIRDGLEYFVQNYETLGITSVAFPALGCGCGGLRWIDVKKVLLEYLKNVEIPVYIYV